MAMAALAVAILATATFLTGCGAQPAPPKRMTIATGGTGGVYYLLGSALATGMRDRWHADAKVKSTAASIENINLLDRSEADLGFATVDSAALAMAGNAPFTHPIGIAALAGLYEDYLQIVVRSESPVHDVADLRGYRVSTGSPSSGTEVVAGRVLTAAELRADVDIERSRLSVADSAEALRKGTIDAFFFTGGLPTPAVANLAKTTKIRLLSIEKYTTVLQDRYGDVYATRSIPSHMYDLGTEVATIGIANVLLVRSDMSIETAYQLTALLFDLREDLIAAHPEARRLTHSSALSTLPVALHPGAAQYYRDRKS